MNKKIRVCVIVVLVCLVLITGTYSIYHYRFEYSPGEWFRESIRDGEYVIVGHEIGTNIFSGDTQVEIAIFNHVNWCHMTTFETTIRNRRKKLTADNYRIEHNDEYIKIILIDSDDQRKVAYRFFFKDFKY